MRIAAPSRPRLHRIRQALLFLACSITLSAQAQFYGANDPRLQRNDGTSGMFGAGAMSAPGGIGTAGGTGAGQPGTPQIGPPTLPVRPDMGAGDVPPLQRTTANPARASVPSQFQRFVLEATGTLLPNYGQNLFNNPSAYVADTAVPAPAEYRLGPGDEVRVQIWGTVDYVGSQTLDRNGQINLPKIGTIALAGTQVKDLEAVLKKQVASVFTNVNLSAGLGRLRGITVYVVGQADQPGTYNLSSLSTLVNAIFASGGPSTNGSMRNITLRRAGRIVTTFDLYDFISKGDQSKDVSLMPGDVITIPPSGAKVAVTGAWDHSAIFEIKPGATLNDVLDLGGGVPPMASPRKALLERIQGDQRQPKQVIEVALDAQGLKTALRDGDLVTLLKISPAFSNAVTLQGSVAAPLRYQWSPNMRVLDLIPDREALLSPDYYTRKNHLVQMIVNEQGNTGSASASVQGVNRVLRRVEQINWDYAVIERLGRNNLRTELIPFNLGKAVIEKDPAHNLPLQPGDIVTIMSSGDLRLPVDRQVRLVKVEGEVAAPGVYQALPGETLPQLIARIGGVTPQAYVYGSEFTRESVRRRQQQNLEQVIQRLEAQYAASANAQVTNITGDRAQQSAAVVQAQQVQMKTQIERLKTIRSQGRVALELDPKLPGATETAAIATPLPAVALEDGDTILIPATPSFVSAVGSVNNENAILYKPGKTVGDVLKSAGLSEDAEPSESFLLRADGTVVSRKNTGFFGGRFESIPLMPGDTVVVPAMLDRESRYNFITRAFKDWTQVLANFGIGVAAIKVLKN